MTPADDLVCWLFHVNIAVHLVTGSFCPLLHWVTKSDQSAAVRHHTSVPPYLR